MLLSTDIWVSALIRRAELAGAFAMVMRKGDARAGAVLVKVLNRPEADRQALCRGHARLDGERVWMQPARSDQEPDLDAYIERAAASTPTSGWWRSTTARGRHFLTEPVEKS